ncbi:MAG: maleylpyruvate isomerase family mycothiol-dependent enzyme [Acidimicrobiales bacterium]
MDPVVAALGDQQAELRDLVRSLDDAGWHASTRCAGWDVADVVLHLCQTDEMAIASVKGSYASMLEGMTAALDPASSVDSGAAALVEHERGASNAALLQRWSTGAMTLLEALEATDMHTRVQWVTGELSARTLATTRLAETWIHTGDIAGALDIELKPTARLWQIARLAWRTLPYAFASEGRTLAGPVAFRLVGPSGEKWDLVADEGAATTISGLATELCDVAARRVDASSTRLRGEGPDAATVLALVRTYAS